MAILAFDTSTSTCTVALKLAEKCLLQEERVPKQHVKKILYFIDNLLIEAGICLDDLDAIAFGCGPGSFTGLRIAASIAQGLAFGVNKPLISVSSLQIAAQTAYRLSGAHHVLVAQDARLHEVYFGRYQHNGAYMAAVEPDQLCAPRAVQFDAHAEKYLGVGDAWQAYEHEFVLKPHNINFALLPSALDLAELSVEMLKTGKIISPEQAKPNYLRNNVVCHK